MCSGQNSLGKGGLNAKAGFCYPYNNRYISFLPSDDTEIFISRNVKAKRREFIECDIITPILKVILAFYLLMIMKVIVRS